MSILDPPPASLSPAPCSPGSRLWPGLTRGVMRLYFCMRSKRGIRRQHWLSLCIWAVFVAGLLVQVFAPHLKIANGAFMIPPALVADGNNIHLDQLIQQERRMQMISLILTVSGALGLAFRYRHTLKRSVARRSDEPVPQPAEAGLRPQYKWTTNRKGGTDTNTQPIHIGRHTQTGKQT
jgi:hypothetical protein